MTEEFNFTEAVRENVHVIIGLAGASGSGKTKTALELATGLVGPRGKIGVADTESRRALHYANGPNESDPDKYRFLHMDMRPPFRPQRFEDVIAAAENANLDCLIIDSFSHEYDGEGGIMDWNAELAAGTPKPGIENPRDPKDGDGWKDWLKKPMDGPAAWKEPKAAHKHLVQTTVLQARCHIIFCMRAEEKIRILKRGDPLDPRDPDGPKATKTEIQPMGWMPICEKRFMYEMTLSLTLNPMRPGRPDFNLPHKVQDQHRPFFQEGQFINWEVGQKLAEWAAGGRKVETAPPTPDAYITRVQGALGRATDPAALTAWWNSENEKSLRASAGLSNAQASQLMQAVTARAGELKNANSGDDGENAE